MPYRRPPVLCFDEAGGIGPFPIAVFAILAVLVDWETGKLVNW